jgi:hypothetical protein
MLGYSKSFKGGRQNAAFPNLGTRHAWRSTLGQNVKLSAAAYLRAAQAYMLISMPTDTSTIFGVFQAILALSLLNGRTSPCRLN